MQFNTISLAGSLSESVPKSEPIPKPNSALKQQPKQDPVVKNSSADATLPTISSDQVEIPVAPVTETSRNAHRSERNPNEALENIINEANKALSSTGKGFQYKVHEKTNRVLVKVVDIVSGDVISELPPEKEMDAVAKMWELAGILFDKKS